MKDDDIDRRIDSVLEGLAVGDISPDDPRVHGLLESSERFRREWMSLQRLRKRLSAEDAERDAILSEIDSAHEPRDPGLTNAFRRIATSSATTPEAPADDRRDSASSTNRDSRGRPRTTLAILAAAAILIAAIWIPWFDLLPSGSDTDGDQQIGPETSLLVDLEPHGTVSAESYRTFHWRAPEGLDIEYFQVRILERDEAGELRPFKESVKLRTPSYDAPFDLPPRIRWHVRALDAAGVVVAQGEADAQLATP